MKQCKVVIHALLWVCVLAVTASGTAISGNEGDDQNGFIVYQQKSGEWQKVGFLQYTDMFSENSMQLPVSDIPVKIRLLKKGKGAAHIDRAILDGLPPSRVRGVVDPIPLGKLRDKDFDVIHYDDTKNGIELDFAGSGTLKLAARVESERIAKIPFRFPSSNNFTQISAKSDFFAVHLSDKPQVIFKEKTLPGTGHPIGNALGSAVVEDDTLHVRLDFESDNTLDEEKDYASLHLKTKNGIKTYTITQKNHHWGTARFCYTPVIPWQHKIYDFTIPLSELEETKTIDLAMSAYGTASVGGKVSPAIAYGSNNKEYLAAYCYISGANEIVRTQRYDADGVPIGNYFNITTLDGVYKEEEAVAYNSTDNQFLVAWVQPEGGINAIHTQLVSATNSIVLGTEVAVTLEGQKYPDIAYSPVNNHFFMVWEEVKTSGTVNDIYGMLVDHLNQQGTNIIISNTTDFEYSPRVAYHSQSDTYYVVWEKAVGLGSQIFGRMYQSDGTPKGIATSIHLGPAGQERPDIAIDPVHNRSLVVWEDFRNPGAAGSDIYAGILGDGLLGIGEAIPLATKDGGQYTPQVTYVGDGVFLVLWVDKSVDPFEIHGRFVTSYGKLIGAEKILKKSNTHVAAPSLVTVEKNQAMALYVSFDIATSQADLDTAKFHYVNPWKIFLSLPAITHDR